MDIQASLELAAGRGPLSYEAAMTARRRHHVQCMLPDRTVARLDHLTPLGASSRTEVLKVALELPHRATRHLAPGEGIVAARGEKIKEITAIPDASSRGPPS